MQSTGISGPCFVSIGDTTKLNIFLEKNPNINRDFILVDDYNLEAYKSIGLKNILEDKSQTIQGSARMSSPGLSASEWFSYMSSVGSLIPTDKPFKFGDVPQGVLKLGGTFGIINNVVNYVHLDGVPGDHPNPTDVLKSFENIDKT
eukprot:gene10473-21847_t